MTRAGRSNAAFLARRGAYYLRSAVTLLYGVRPAPALWRLFAVPRRRRERILRLRASGMAFAVRGAMDAWIVKETCLDRAYERAGARIEDGWRIVDIGAALGDFAVLAARAAPHGVVHAYEPQPASFALLETNLRLNAVSNVRAFAEAVASRRGPAARIRDGTREQQAQVGAVDGDSGSEAAAGVSLADVVARLPGGACDLLKLDCEGAEYEILFAGPPDLWPRVRRIVLEYHDVADGRSHRELEAFLTGQGYACRCSPSRVRAGLGMLYGLR